MIFRLAQALSPSRLHRMEMSLEIFAEMILIGFKNCHF